MNPLKRTLKRVYKWIYFKLYIESDDPNAPYEIKSRKRIINNSFVIQLCVLATAFIIYVILFFIFFYLISIPYFVLDYVIFTLILGVVYLSLMHREKKREKEMIEKM